jgi:hypothetical protein
MISGIQGVLLEIPVSGQIGGADSFWGLSLQPSENRGRSKHHNRRELSSLSMKGYSPSFQYRTKNFYAVEARKENGTT